MTYSLFLKVRLSFLKTITSFTGPQLHFAGFLVNDHEFGEEWISHFWTVIQGPIKWIMKPFPCCPSTSSWRLRSEKCLWPAWTWVWTSVNKFGSESKFVFHILPQVSLAKRLESKTSENNLREPWWNGLKNIFTQWRAVLQIVFLRIEHE